MRKLFSAPFNTPWGWLWISVAVVALDHVTKVWASTSLTYGWPHPVLPFLSWTLAHNTGAAFSFLHDAGGWQRWLFIAIAVAVSGGLIAWLRRQPPGAIWIPVAIALLFGGAIGNLYDRALQGYVVDFIHVHWMGWNFPAFNIADCGITVGAIMLIIDSLILAPERESKA